MSNKLATITITGARDVIAAIEDIVAYSENTLTDILCDSYGYENREEAEELCANVEYTTEYGVKENE